MRWESSLYFINEVRGGLGVRCEWSGDEEVIVGEMGGLFVWRCGVQVCLNLVLLVDNDAQHIHT